MSEDENASAQANKGQRTEQPEPIKATDTFQPSTPPATRWDEQVPPFSPAKPQNMPVTPASSFLPPAPHMPVENGAEVSAYELWLQAGANNSSNIHEHTAWRSQQAQPMEQTSPETWFPHENTAVPNNRAALPATNPAAQQPAAPARQQESVEQNLMTTLEELELSLRSKGFIPLQPNSLSNVAAQTQGSFNINPTPNPTPDAWQLPEELHQPVAQQEQTVQEQPEPMAADTIPSALAQLGNMARQTLPPPMPLSFSPARDTLEQDMFSQNAQPSWLQALKNTPVQPEIASAAPQTFQNEPAANYQERFTPFQQPAAEVPITNMPPATPIVPVEPIVAEATPTLSSTAPGTGRELQETVKVSIIRGNPLLDNELETTMKRPAVRLQPVQQTSSAPKGGSYIVSRAQSGERIEKAATKVNKSGGENLSQRERLLKGYQHQLVGDYDEAMHEYRQIIRNNTELLGEVISNVRALLKLAPNYAAGYRVLGDAYMRQGEYLQAMESYNKALAITKKAKG